MQNKIEVFTHMPYLAHMADAQELCRMLKRNFKKLSYIRPRNQTVRNG